MLRVKDIKDMLSSDLENKFQGVDDMVLLSPTGLDAISENKIRLDLRKKSILLRLVKNSFLRQVFNQFGLQLQDCWNGPTMVAWGGTSLAQLSKELQKSFKDQGDKIEFKTALADRQQITFKQALDMPTKEEAIGRVLTLAMSPGSRLASQILGPASRVAGQVKSKAEEGDQKDAE